MNSQALLHQNGCARCGGTGKIRYTIPGDLEPRPFASDGTTIQTMDGWGTRACLCVRDLPPIEGKATWWESETVWNGVFTDTIQNEAAEITVDAEVPRDDTGRRVVMRGNRYYPTWVDFEGPPRMSMHPSAARELALKLLAAAEACDAVDEPCSDSCGHWAPCDCKTAEPMAEPWF